MGYVQTVDTEELFRVENEDGSSVTVSQEEEEGRILSINFLGDPKEEMELLFAAESIGEERGVSRFEMDFFSGQGEKESLLHDAGYEIKEGVRVFSVDTGELFASAAFRKALRGRCPGAIFTPLEELFITQWDGLLDTLEHFFVRIGSDLLGTFSQEMSGVVYNDDMVMKAVVLCSERGDSLHIDLLLGTMKKEPQYIMAALQGMLRKLSEIGGEDTFRTLTMVGANSITESLLKRVLDSSYEVRTLGVTKYASKELGESHPFKISNDPDPSKENAWWEELSESPIQGNVSWKMVWMRERSANAGEE